MKEIARKALLYDFYGELLTDHQKSVYEDAVMNDFSLSELAEEYGISRQGVHDLLKRCDAILEEYEKKLGLIERFGNLKGIAGEVLDGLDELEKTENKEDRSRIIAKLKKEIAGIEAL